MKPTTKQILVRAGNVELIGDLSIPETSSAVVVFAHGSGSGRHSPRNLLVARELHEGGLSTLLLDLLTHGEQQVDEHTRHLRFDVFLLGQRLIAAVDWLRHDPKTSAMAIGLYGASTGAAAVLIAAAQRSKHVEAIVCRGGRPDLAGPTLRLVTAPTLLIVGGADEQVGLLNQCALRRLAGSQNRIESIVGAGHLFEEPGTMEQVANLTRRWFEQHLHRPNADGGRRGQAVACGKGEAPWLR